MNKEIVKNEIIHVKCDFCGNNDPMDNYTLMKESISFYSRTYNKKIQVNLNYKYICSKSILGECRRTFYWWVSKELTRHMEADESYAWNMLYRKHPQRG